MHQNLALGVRVESMKRQKVKEFFLLFCQKNMLNIISLKKLPMRKDISIGFLAK